MRSIISAGSLGVDAVALIALQRDERKSAEELSDGLQSTHHAGDAFDGPASPARRRRRDLGCFFPRKHAAAKR